tara:strand:+ start:155 stop:331 length:177 start_codon:yes stop_codon:yes gene_type:complete
MEPPDIKDEFNSDIEFVESKKVSCDGGGGALGHPKVYLEMGDENEIICPYCSKLFRII